MKPSRKLMYMERVKMTKRRKEDFLVAPLVLVLVLVLLVTFAPDIFRNFFSRLIG